VAVTLKPSALLTDGDAEQLYTEVQGACPAAADPVVAR
jgi:hypothetical protein